MLPLASHVSMPSVINPLPRPVYFLAIRPVLAYCIKRKELPITPTPLTNPYSYFFGYSGTILRKNALP